MPRYNYFPIPGDMPLALTVKLTSNDIPATTVNDYSAFSSVRITTVNAPLTGKGVGYANVSDSLVSSYEKAPKFPCRTSTTQVPHFFEAILLSTSQAASYYLHQQITVQFINFDG